MRPNKKGQIAKFHTPLPDENPEQLYVVLEVIEDDDRPRAQIQALNTGLSFVPINTVSLNDLEVVEVNTQDLIGHQVTINKSDFSQVKGKVIKVDEQKIMLDLTKGVTGVETNVWLTIIDENGKEQMGTLYVDMKANH
jgi:transcription antitermination factor NusG